MAKKRNWSKEEKIALLKEVDQEDLQLTIRKYKTYLCKYCNWWKKCRESGKDRMPVLPIKPKAIRPRLITPSRHRVG